MFTPRWLLSFPGLVFVSGALLAQTIAVHPRITQPVNESRLTVLRGNTHPLARPQFDRGTAAADLPMNRMLLVLQRSPEQEAALEKLLDDQQDKSSPGYHKWLTPEEFGQQFGPADQDIATITSWLQGRGFQVANVSKGRTVIEFSGTAAQVQEAFHTSIHRYVVDGEDHVANATDPEIPAALAPVVAGVLSLHDFRARPLHHDFGVVSRSKATGEVTPAQPLFTIPASGGCGVQRSNCYAVGPYDFATIYNVLPLWSSAPAIDGTGQTIAIVGETDINPQDVTDFRNFFGLPPANLQIIHDGPAPGILQNGEETESDLDVEWSGAVAPGATIDFVVASSTVTTQGIHLSALHIIDNDLAPVMSESYGSCELFMGTAGNQFLNQLWQQAAAEGITVMIATGDSGSAVCEDRSLPPPAPAYFGLEVSGYSSTPYNVAVGGTDFNDLTTAATYWNSANDSTTRASAKSYIPETTWNDTCTNQVFGALLGFSTNAETNCNNSQLINFVSAIGSSGGKSSCISSDGHSRSSCTGGYAKPSWQSALTPNDGVRDVPDISLFSATGFFSGSFYAICQADQVPGYTSCSSSDPYTAFLGIGGTSASAPAFAGIMALVNQQTGSRQGNANYVLYKLGSQQPTAFHDVTIGTIAMPCQTGSPNCNTAISGHQYGVLTGYNAVAGYDLATGLGSVDAFNLVTKWNSVTLLPSVTTLSSLTPTTITHGQPVSVSVAVAPQSGTGTPAGDVTLVGGPTGSVTDFDNHVLSNGTATWTTSLLPGGTYNVTAHYPGDGTYSASDSATSIPVVVNKENGNVAVGLVTFDGSGHLISSNATTAPYGSPYILRMGVTGTTCSSNSRGQAGCPTGSVSLTDNGNPLDAGTYELNNLGYAEDWVVQLTGGSHAVQAAYAGDNSFNTSSLTSNLTITPATTTITKPYVQYWSVGQNFSASVRIEASSNGAAPTGSVTFLVNGVPVAGTVSYQATAGSGSNPTATLTASFTSSSSAFPTSGTYSISASYGGDSNYGGSTSEASSVQVKYPNPILSISPSNVTVAPGESVTVSATVDTNFKNAPVPTGTIPFIYWGPGTLVNGTETYTTTTDSSGNVVLQASITFVPPANASVAASYQGDMNYPPVAGGGLANITVTGSDFALIPNATSVTLSPGQQNGLSIFVLPQSNYNGTINFASASCSGLPKESVCSFNPTSVTGIGYSNLTVSTTAPRQTSLRTNRIGWMLALWAPLTGLMLISTSRRGKHLILLTAVALLLVGLPSCGGGGPATTGGGGVGGTWDPGTPKGTYTITVTAVSGTITHTATFQLVVQ